MIKKKIAFSFLPGFQPAFRISLISLCCQKLKKNKLPDRSLNNKHRILP